MMHGQKNIKLWKNMYIYVIRNYGCIYLCVGHFWGKIKLM